MDNQKASVIYGPGEGSTVSLERGFGRLGFVVQSTNGNGRWYAVLWALTGWAAEGFLERFIGREDYRLVMLPDEADRSDVARAMVERLKAREAL